MDGKDRRRLGIHLGWKMSGHFMAKEYDTGVEDRKWMNRIRDGQLGCAARIRGGQRCSKMFFLFICINSRKI
jgi:hypothetical protein